MKPTMLAMFGDEPESAGMVEEQLVQLAGSQKVGAVQSLTAKLASMSWGAQMRPQCL